MPRPAEMEANGCDHTCTCLHCPQLDKVRWVCRFYEKLNVQLKASCDGEGNCPVEECEFWQERWFAEPEYILETLAFERQEAAEAHKAGGDPADFWGYYINELEQKLAEYKASGRL